MQIEYDEQKVRDLLITGSKMLQSSLRPKVVDDLLFYISELVRWSKKMNLVGKALSVEQIVENHFLDSLTLLHCLDSSLPHLLDVGSGAGFPGLVCKVAKEDLALTIIEPRLKRVSFLSYITRTLRLDRVEIVAARIEDSSLFSPDISFSHITCRAVSELATFLRMIDGLAFPGVRIVCMKGPKWQQELEQAENVIAEMSLRLTDKRHFNLPFSQAERTLLVFEKHNSLPTK